MKQVVGFRVPYCRNDLTTYALRMAEALENNHTHSPHLVPGQWAAASVDARWDRNEFLFRSDSTSFPHWLPACDVVVWFDLQPKSMKRSFVHGCRNVWVPVRGRWRTADLDAALPWCHRVLAPTFAQAHELCVTVSPSKLRTLPPYHPVFLPSAPLPSEDRPLIYGVVVEDIPYARSATEVAVEVLMNCDLEGEIKVESSFPLGQKTISRLQKAKSRLHGKLSVLRRGSYQKHLDFLASCDWVIFAASKYSTLTSVQDAIALGSAVVVVNDPCVREVVIDGVHGSVVPASRAVSHSGQFPVMAPDQLELTVARLAGDRELLQDMRHKAFERRYAAPTIFEAGVRRLLTFSRDNPESTPTMLEPLST